MESNSRAGGKAGPCRGEGKIQKRDSEMLEGTVMWSQDQEWDHKDV